MNSFSQDEINQIESRGSLVDKVKEQIAQFVNGVAFADLARPATIDDGIIALDDGNIAEYIGIYEASRPGRKILKFVPASGAATRMFKELFKFIEDHKENNAVDKLADNLDQFPFYKDLIRNIEQKNGDKKDVLEICKSLLLEDGLNYGQLPKGLLKFHNYGSDQRTPFQEQLIEGANYANQGESSVKLHFTVSENHMSRFTQHLDETRKLDPWSANDFEIEFSTQKKSTDTIAVDMYNAPFKPDGKTFLFRPGGHGALINNLNELDADVIFIKNIDNVVHDDHKADTFTYKKVIAGVLLSYQKKVFDYIDKLKKSDIGNELLSEVESFVQTELSIELPSSYSGLEDNEKFNVLLRKLNRPMRVCGMVKNTGEPGGGPFWVKSKDGSTSLQIVESAQVNDSDISQKDILMSSTHFNPVDLVCAIKDFEGNKFNLTEFVDPDSGFITYKSTSGKDIKALEHPGLWNGAMADWITLFVEVPITTFNPVKTVIDLLKSDHRPKS